MKKRYKIWMSIEEISGEEGNEEYKDMDDIMLPLPLYESLTLVDGIDYMEKMYENNYVEVNEIN